MAENVGREITTGEAAEILGVNQASITRWAREGKIPHWTTPGGQRRFRREDIDALKQGTRVAPLVAADAPTEVTDSSAVA